MSDPLVPGLPAVASLGYANTLISVVLEFEPSKQVTAGLFQRSVGGTPLATGTSAGSGISMFYSAEFDPDLVYYVALAFDSVNGPWGVPVALVWQQPTLAAVFADLNLVEVAWSLPVATTITSVRASLYDTNAQARVVTGVFSGMGTRLVPPLPLSRTGKYAISLSGVNGVASGPEAMTSALSLTVPVVSSAAYSSADGGKYAVTITLQQPVPPSTAVVAQLLRDGIAVQQQTADSSPITLTFSQPLDPRSKWLVNAYFLSDVMAGPSGFPLPLEVPDVPPIASLFYVDGNIVVSLASPATPGATLALFQGSPSGRSWMASTTTSGSSASLSIDPSVLQPGFVYNVALALDSNAVPVIWGLATTLVWQQPTLAALVVSRNAVDVAWTLPATTTITEVTASLFDAGNAVTIAIETGRASGARLDIPTALDPGGNYIARLIARNGVSFSAEIDSSALILSAPQVAAIAYTYSGEAQSFLLTVTAQVIGDAPGTIVGRLLCQGQVVAEMDASGTTVTFKISQPLDAASSWQVVLFFRSGVMVGPPGIPSTVEVPAVPVITALTCAKNAVDVTLAAPPVPQATVALFKGSPSGTNWITSTTSNNSFATLSVDTSKLDPMSQYAVALTLNAAAATVVWGPAVTLVWQQPTLDSVSVADDGVEVCWTLPAPTTIAEVMASVYDGTAKAIVATGSFSAGGARLVPAKALDATHTYTVSIVGVSGVAAAAAVTSPALILTSPMVAQSAYGPGATAGTYEIEVTPAPASSPPGAVIGQLLANGIPVATAAANGGTVKFTRAQALDASTTWQIALLYGAGVVSGPAGVYSEIPQVPPELASALFDGTSFYVAWRGASGANVVITCLADQRVVGTATVANGFSARVQPSGAIDGTKRYAVTLAPIVGTAQGLGGPSTALIVAKPTLASVAANGEQVAVMFANIDPNATATELLLTSSGGSVLTVPAGLDGGYALLPQDGISGLKVAVRAVAGNIAGPASNATTVILATPSIAHVAFAGTAVTGKVTAPAGVTLDASALDVTLYADGIPVSAPVRADSEGSFSVPTSGSCGALTLTARQSGTAAAVAVTAPQSLPIPVLWSAPAIVSASLVQAKSSGWQVAAEWQIPAGPPVRGYQVTLAQGGASLQDWTVAGTSLSQPAPSFDAQKAVTLTVTPLGDTGTGPASGAATFLPSAVSTIAARVDGSLVSASWATDTTAGRPTAFRLRLVQSTLDVGWVTAARSATVGASMAVAALPPLDLRGTALFGITVDAAVENAWVSTQAVATLVATAPSLTTAVTKTAGAVAIAWAWPNGEVPAAVDGYLPVILWNGTETALAKLPATPLQATVTIPATTPSGALISLRALAGAITGPAGIGVPLVFQAPTDVMVAYDGANIDVSWSASTDARVQAYSVTFTASGQMPVVDIISDTAWQKAFVPTSGQSAGVTVAAVAGVATGPAAAPVDAIFQAPVINGAVFDGTTLTLGWSGAGDAAAKWTVISILTDGVPSRQIICGGSAAAIPFESGPSSIRLQGAGKATIGTPSTPFVPITTAPAISSVAFSLADGALTLVWTAVANAGGYKVAFRNATSVAERPATTTSLVVAASDLPASGIYAVSVQATGSASSDAVAGPWSKPAPLVLIVPPSIRVRYDGRSAYVSWSPVAAGEVSGYAVTLRDGATTVSTLTTADTSALVAAPYAPTKNYQVIVQAITSAGAARPSAAMPVFRGGWYLSCSTSEAAHIKPFSTAAMGSSDIVVYLPNIFATYVASGLPAIPPFLFATTQRTPFVYTLTMPAASIVWTFDGNTPRQNVQEAYAALLSSLIALGLTPFGWRIVQDAIARAMPQTFGETLGYAYAFHPADGSIDLKPGMILRADFEAYQYLGQDQGASRYLDGFVASNSVEYEIASYVAGSNWLTGFDAFLSAITLQGTSVPTPSNDGSNYSGGGGIVDLYYAQLRQPFLRLVYPPQFLASGEADARPAFNAAVLAAVDYPTLQTATANLRNARPLGTGAYAAYLRGRTTLSACIRVWVNGMPMVVPVGTTVGNLLESMAARPPIFPLLEGAPATTPGIPISGLTLTRATGYAITDPDAGTSGYAVDGGMPVMLDWSGGMAYSALADWLSLPLLAGDRLATEDFQ